MRIHARNKALEYLRNYGAFGRYNSRSAGSVSSGWLDTANLIKARCCDAAAREYV